MITLVAVGDQSKVCLNISKNDSQEFILSCQDPENGGISDRPDDMADVFHTVFGIAGLSLLGKRLICDEDIPYLYIYNLPHQLPLLIVVYILSLIATPRCIMNTSTIVLQIVELLGF